MFIEHLSYARPDAKCSGCKKWRFEKHAVQLGWGRRDSHSVGRVVCTASREREGQSYLGIAGPLTEVWKTCTGFHQG